VWDLRRTDELPALITEAEALAGTLGDRATRAELLYNLAAIKCVSGRPDEARPTADEALATAQASGDAWTIAMCAWARALAAGNADELRERIDEAASLLAGVGNAYSLATLLCLAVDLAFERGSDAEAAMYLDRAVPAARRLDQPHRWLPMLKHIGLVALLRGDSAAADGAFREALTLSHDLVLADYTSVALTGLGAVAAVQGRPERAARLAGAATAHRDADNVVSRRLEATFIEPERILCGREAWEAAAGEGHAFSIQDATVYALEQAPVRAGRVPTKAPAPGGHAG